jgi:alkaline phosphatase
MRLVARLLILLAVVLTFGLEARAGEGQEKKPLAKNVIVMICDGWGYNHLEAASYYEYGKDARQVFNRFPFNYAMSTYSADGHGYDPQLAWSDFDYVKSGYTDSASAATAMSTGVKTYDAAIGVDVDGNPLRHVLELAEELGKSTGVINERGIHPRHSRGFRRPQRAPDYAAIGQEMINTSAADVIMGAGHPWFDHNGAPRSTPNTFQYVGGQVTWDALVAGTAGGDADGDGIADPWVLIQSRAEFQSLANGPTPKRVLGTAQVYQTLQQGRSGDAYADPFVVPLTLTVPTLEEMTKAALNVLDDNPLGLFLMVEGGAVDWAAHSNQSGRMIEEQLDFERSVDAVLDWVQKYSNWGETLVIVTGDHETGYLTGPGSDPLAWTRYAAPISTTPASRWWCLRHLGEAE